MKATRMRLMLFFSGVLLAGCATNSDIENLQSQIDVMKIELARIKSEVDLLHAKTDDALDARMARLTHLEEEITVLQNSIKDIETSRSGARKGH